MLKIASVFIKIENKQINKTQEADAVQHRYCTQGFSCQRQVEREEEEEEEEEEKENSIDRSTFLSFHRLSAVWSELLLSSTCTQCNINSTICGDQFTVTGHDFFFDHTIFYYPTSRRHFFTFPPSSSTF